MKNYLLLTLMLAVLLPAAATNAEWTYLGDYVAPYKVDGNVVTFTCSPAPTPLTQNPKRPRNHSISEIPA
ncbi:MAG TPA: hypothetical protein VMW16_09845 [Sedimentisphaerales bacterium]|nr:hypothetical protein [Sedimentisphaerales bacterium]